MASLGGQNPLASRPRGSVVVVRSWMKPEDWPDVSVVEPGTAVEWIAAMKAGKCKEIWLFGGGQLLCFHAGLVDMIETAIMPVLLASRVRLAERHRGTVGSQGFPLGLVSTQRLEQSGILMCKYEIIRKGG